MPTLWDTPTYCLLRDSVLCECVNLTLERWRALGRSKELKQSCLDLGLGSLDVLFLVSSALFMELEPPGVRLRLVSEASSR